MPQMYKGKVRWFSISEDESVFVHFSDIEGEGYRTLYKGETVEFEVVETDKGKKAVNVRRVK